jgi:iron complex transport system substrate-binding protein
VGARRVVSLVASATEIAAALGIGERLVGVSADSDWPHDVARGLPVLNSIAFDPDLLTSREIDAAASQGHSGTSLYHVDAELLRRLHPDLILTQEVCDVCSVSRRDLEAASHLLGYAPVVLSLNAVDLTGLREDIVSVAAAADVQTTAERLLAQFDARLNSVSRRTADLAKPRVACLEWLDPLYSGGHWVPEMVEIAGGTEALGLPSGPSRQLAWDELAAYAPDVIVFMPCSLSLERVVSEFHLVRDQEAWPSLPAVQAGRVYALHTDLFSRSGPRLADGVEALARVLHPDVFTSPLPAGVALKVATDGRQLEPHT